MSMPTRTRHNPSHNPRQPYPRQPNPSPTPARWRHESDANRTRRQLCTHLGRQALSGAPRVLHSKATSWAGRPPPPTPCLPHGTLWSLVNHLKVLHQYVELVSEAAAGTGAHAAHLCGRPEACTHGLEWFAPLLSPLRAADEAEYRLQVEAWRQANPGLYGDAEAAYLVHQGYIVEDASMTRHLVRTLMEGRGQELDVAVAGNILRARPDSFDDFSAQFLRWRERALYHLLCLGARHMPLASQWAPGAECWQGVLDCFNASGFCSEHRLEEACEALQCRPALGTRICAVLDRLAVLARVHSVYGTPLDESLAKLQFERDPASPYAQCQRVWGTLKNTVFDCVPPSLLCPALYPPNRDTWGYAGMQLKLFKGCPWIDPGMLQWLDKGQFCKEPSAPLPDRLHDILLRMGEAATAPEVAHLMLSPGTLRDILSGLSPPTPDFGNRDYVLSEMDKGPTTDPEAFGQCVQRIVASLPEVAHTALPSPLQLLAWRVDCPPRAILYEGDSSRVDLAATPPYQLHKTIWLDKVPNRTVSGVSVLSRPCPDHGDAHEAIRACIAEDVVAPHADFADHPFHQVSEGVHTTTLAEAVALFTGPPPEKLSEVPLHHSAPWEAPHVDDRYAERQVASNGMRFRDWAAVYHDGCELQRCRLAAHALRTLDVYHTHFPLAGHPTRSWVAVASSLPPETVVLRHQTGRGELDSLKRSVEMRFMHDRKLLPVRRKGDSLEREHMEIYSDEAAGQVLIAYAPKSADGSLEFISFALA